VNDSLDLDAIPERSIEQEIDSLEKEALKQGEFVGITNDLALRLVAEVRRLRADNDAFQVTLNAMEAPERAAVLLADNLTSDDFVEVERPRAAVDTQSPTKPTVWRYRNVYEKTGPAAWHFCEYDPTEELINVRLPGHITREIEPLYVRAEEARPLATSGECPPNVAPAPSAPNTREVIAKALWETQKPLDALDTTWEELDVRDQAVYRHDADAVIHALNARAADASSPTPPTAVGWAYWLDDHWHLCADEPTAHATRKQVYIISPPALGARVSSVTPTDALLEAAAKAMWEIEYSIPWERAPHPNMSRERAKAALDAAALPPRDDALRNSLRDLLDIVEREVVSDLSDNDLALAYAYSGQLDVEREAIAEQEIRRAVAAARAVLTAPLDPTEATDE